MRQPPVAVNRPPGRLRQASRVFLSRRLGLEMPLIVLGCAAGATAEPLRRSVLAFVASGLLVVGSAISLRLGCSMFAVWLILEGLIRRVVAPGTLAGIDPLLLVAPIFTLYIYLRLQADRPEVQKTRLVRAVFALQTLCFLSVVNPFGSLRSDLIGAVVVGVPTAWFQIGSNIPRSTLKTILTVVQGSAVVVAMYGINQTLRGFPSWDEAWIERSGYTALHVGTVIRAFSTLSNAAEYAALMGVCVVISISKLLSRFSMLSILALPLCLVALTLESSRSVLVTTILGSVFVLVVRSGLRLKWALLVVIPVIIGISSLAGHLLQSDAVAGNDLLSHQVSGLSDPTGQGSTLGLHLTLLQDGLTSAASNPVGAGLGAITSAAGTVGGGTSGTEADPSNAAVALGAPGLLAYLVILISGIKLAYGSARVQRRWWLAGGLGTLLVLVPQWLNGGQYSVVWLPWLILGYLTQPTSVPAPSATVERSPIPVSYERR